MAQDIIEKHLNKLFEYMGIDPDARIDPRDEGYEVIINGDDLNFLIGYRGESLDALQTLLGHSIFKELKQWVPIYVDINGYKKSKLDKLEEMVKSFIDRVRFHQKEIALPFLTPYERRHVHTFISDYMDVKSESRGEGKDRRMFLFPSNNQA